MAKDEALTDAPALAVLELLAQESPPGHFQDLLQRGRRQNLPPDQLAELERATQLAMGIHASANQRRQREVVMAALVDTVHDMTTRYDPDTLLKVITSRARRLLGFDMAYISLRRSAGGSYIHSSDGDTTALNVGLVVEERRGLGEMAQDKGAPFWTSDYLNDDRIPHGEGVDEVVRAEGLHAIMAVPIFQGSAPIGALYGADRVVRHFTPDEISVMRSLADFASVALEKARLLDRTRTEIAELESAGFEARGTIARMAYLNEVQSRLIAQVLDGGDLYDIVKAAADALGGALAVGDPQGADPGVHGLGRRGSRRDGGSLQGGADRPGGAGGACLPRSERALREPVGDSRHGRRRIPRGRPAQGHAAAGPRGRAVLRLRRAGRRAAAGGAAQCGGGRGSGP
ncbi:hypothetical protein GCM10010425_06400 [Streptomyces spororaveus]|uniref:GAF domain-containing protein n=1 Tax=Streptomyces spororaveus TaxID=284039 RepID=A0ABQ3TF38_9ACTN|nr:GAF domain-containing protein [Streptomyces spororaveus]GHI79030.1 hypothetical protein Sspor_45910 [Streptomyces spororaveus]